MNSEMRDSILLVEDSLPTRALLRDIFSDTYNVLEAENGAQAMVLLHQNFNHIAVMLLDINMPIKDGHQVLAEMKADENLQHIPVVVVTGDNTPEGELRALRLGAVDVFAKPFVPEILQRRVHNIAELHRYKWYLEERVAEQGDVLRQSNEMMVDALSSIIEHRSLESGSHVLRIRGFTRILLDQVSSVYPEYDLDEQGIDTIVSASTLHDIGKISVPDSILNKPGRLTPEEFEVMKAHTTAGAAMLETLQGIGAPEYLYFAHNICRYHHERWDGRGYPDGLKGDEIPLCAQVVGVADVYDALTTVRVYKPAFSHQQAMNMILNGECGAFNPMLMECFKAVSDQFEELALSYADHAPVRSDHSGDARTESGVQRVSREPDPHLLAQVKYQAMLRYADATVVEVDAGRKLYHIVYNPDPHLIPPLASSSLSEFLLSMVGDRVHPDDYALLQDINGEGLRDFFRRNLRKLSFRYRLFHPGVGDYVPYEVNFLRMELNDPGQRRFIAIWKQTQDFAPQQIQATAGHRVPPDIIHTLTSNLIHLRADNGGTILDGVQNLCALTGFTAAEIASHFHNRFVELVVPEDREALLQNLFSQLERGHLADWEHRLLHKSGVPVWVFHRARLSTGEDGTETLYCTIMDNTGGRAVQEQTSWMQQRNQTIIDQSNDIIFEWNILHRTLMCSSKWEQIFGYPLATDETGQTVPHSDHIHPEDLALLREKLDWAQLKDPHVESEIRILSGDGRYLWCRLRATLLRDSDGSPMRLVGTITNVDELKRSILTLQEKAEQDALTRLLNKESTRRHVEAALRERLGSKKSSALLIIDLDNFKQINDRYGHLFGDELLTRVSMELRRLFRSNDIIGRIGGDEFLVFLSEVPNRALVEERCTKLNEAFRSVFREQKLDYPVSCSIGAALSPLHGSTYPELFQKADRALYQSKANGRDCHVVYDAEMLADLPANLPAIIGTDIDSDARPGMAGDSMVRYVFRHLYETRDLEEAINTILATIGKQMNVSRVYIYENNADNTACSNTFEWCNEGVSAEMANLQNISYETDLRGWMDCYNEQGVFYCPDITQLPDSFRAILEPQGIKSMLQCSIRDGGVFRGYVGFDENFTNRLWTQDQIDLLNFLSELLALFLLKKRAQDETARQSLNLRSVLDNQPHWIYVVDSDLRIRYLNARCRELDDSLAEGQFCYRSIMRDDAPCANCPVRYLRTGDEPSAIIENPNYGLRVHAEAAPIRWNDRDAYLVTCRRLAPEGPDPA